MYLQTAKNGGKRRFLSSTVVSQWPVLCTLQREGMRTEYSLDELEPTTLLVAADILHLNRPSSKEILSYVTTVEVKAQRKALVIALSTLGVWSIHTRLPTDLFV